MARLFFLDQEFSETIVHNAHTPTNHWAEQANSVQTKISPTCLVLWPEEQRKPWRLHRKVKISMFTSTEMRVWVGGMARTQKRSEGPLSIGAHIKTRFSALNGNGCSLAPNSSIRAALVLPLPSPNCLCRPEEGKGALVSILLRAATVWGKKTYFSHSSVFSREIKLISMKLVLHNS
jgi:hypothetical protein